MKPNDKAIEAGVKLCWDCPRATPSMIRDILTAAYAAQFPPSEEYARLVKWLRDKAESLSEIYPPEAEAADAFEALLAERDAERDALKAELANAQKLGKMQAERIGDHIKKIEDRDALLTLLAPVDDDSRHLTTDEQKIFHSALRRYAKIKKPVNDEVLLAERDALKGLVKIYEKKLSGIEDEIRLAAQSAIAAVRPHIEAAERERCAKIAESHKYPMKTIAGTGYNNAANEIAAAIRSGK